MKGVSYKGIVVLVIVMSIIGFFYIRNDIKKEQIKNPSVNVEDPKPSSENTEKTEAPEKTDNTEDNDVGPELVKKDDPEFFFNTKLMEYEKDVIKRDGKYYFSLDKLAELTNTFFVVNNDKVTRLRRVDIANKIYKENNKKYVPLETLLQFVIEEKEEKETKDVFFLNSMLAYSEYEYNGNRYVLSEDVIMNDIMKKKPDFITDDGRGSWVEGINQIWIEDDFGYIYSFKKDLITIE